MRSDLLPPLLSNAANDRQSALITRYRRQPEAAWATHLAWTEDAGTADPYRGTVRVGLSGRALPFSLDDGVGGPHDAPAPGELLCAALAASISAAIRIVASRSDLAIERLTVMATGDVDSRGALGEAGVRVGFQSIRLEIQLRLEDVFDPGVADVLVARAERRCELLQTLRFAVPIEVVIDAG
jgi:uncharacterized OsmC-like protein